MILRRAWRGWLLAGAGWCGLAGLMVRADDPPPAGLTAVSFREQGFWVHTVDPKNEDLRLFWKDDQGRLFGDFNTLEKFLGGKGEHLSFAANAGMFQPDYKSVGLLVQNGAETTTLNLNDGTGNFYMKPNGVFLVNEKHEAMVVESSSYTALLTPAVWATQSGPLLVQRGDPNPDFNAGSANKKIRSGVGVRKDGTIVFALSRVPVNFYDFASLFVDRLKCSNALYLDGEISAFYVPGTKDPVAHSFGPMVGVVKPDVSTPATNSLNTTNAPAVPPPKGP